MTDLQIARSIPLKHIDFIADQLGITSDQLEYYGKYKAKLPLELINYDHLHKKKLILVSGISPTPAGEGKTTVSIGLAQALSKIGKQCTVVLREPSLGPVFGMKGGAAGGGYSQVVPMEDINLHFTGDFAAIEKANNLLAALIDNNLQNKHHSLDIDPRTIVWKRVMDMNDRALRDIIIGLGGTGNGIPRESSFDITAASEIMAILCLSDDLADLKRKLGNIFVGFSKSREPVYARDLKAPGAMAALLKDAIKPNLVQTLEHTPAIIHGGPFANIAQGTNSVIATRMGLSLSEYAVTEAGFGFDLGGEKFLNIKCQASGLKPSAVVLVATIRALKYHGGVALSNLKNHDPEAVSRGIVNLEKHIENVKQFGIQPVVAINKFSADSHEEVAMIQEHCREWGVPAIEADIWAKGGEGGKELGKKVIEIAENGKSKFTPIYNWSEPVEKKIEAIAHKIYGAGYVEYTPQARKDLKRIEKLGLQESAICIAKTQYSFSDDPKRIGRPSDFTLSVREIEIAAGAGFVIPVTGSIMRMPGLPSVPAAENIDIDNQGTISGLF